MRSLTPTRRLGVAALFCLLSAIGGLAHGSSGASAFYEPVVNWPFYTNDGQWVIANGYHGDYDHASGAAQYGLDFVGCAGGTVNGSTCQFDFPDTYGQPVLSPVSGTVYWIDVTCRAIALDIDGYQGYRIEIAHMDPTNGWSQLVGTHFNQGDVIGTVSSSGCQGQGDHIHMSLYSWSGSDSNRTAVPFTGTFTIGSPACDYPSNGSYNQYKYQLAPCEQSSGGNGNPNPGGWPYCSSGSGNYDMSGGSATGPVPSPVYQYPVGGPTGYWEPFWDPSPIQGCLAIWTDQSQYSGFGQPVYACYSVPAPNVPTDIELYHTTSGVRFGVYKGYDDGTGGCGLLGTTGLDTGWRTLSVTVYLNGQSYTAQTTYYVT